MPLRCDSLGPCSRAAQRAPALARRVSEAPVLRRTASEAAPSANSRWRATLFGTPAGFPKLRPPARSVSQAYSAAACRLESEAPALELPPPKRLSRQRGNLALEQSTLGQLNWACRSSPGEPALSRTQANCPRLLSRFWLELSLALSLARRSAPRQPPSARQTRDAWPTDPSSARGD